MDTKYYVDWVASENQWVVRYRGQVYGRFDTQAEAEAFGKRTFPGQGHDTERVVVRENSPRGARRGQWR